MICSSSLVPCLCRRSNALRIVRHLTLLIPSPRRSHPSNFHPIHYLPLLLRFGCSMTSDSDIHSLLPGSSPIRIFFNISFAIPSPKYLQLTFRLPSPTEQRNPDSDPDPSPDPASNVTVHLLNATVAPLAFDLSPNAEIPSSPDSVLLQPATCKHIPVRSDYDCAPFLLSSPSLSTNVIRGSVSLSCPSQLPT